MTNQNRSGRIAIPRSRRLTLDVLHFHKQSATCAHDRLFDLSLLVDLRHQLPVRISWSLMFVKAFGIVAAKSPVLRQTYQHWPWPHIFQHMKNVAMMATHRIHDDEAWVFWSRFEQPELQSLVDLQERLNRYQTEPVKKIFRQQWQLSGLPTFLRRSLWWWTFNIAASKRAHRAGTFFLTTLAAKGVEIQDPPAFLTTNLTYGPMDERNRCRVTMSYDHRLMDGSFVADCLLQLEQVLNTTIADELRSLLPGNVTTSDRHVT
jgi:hypothetical protein